jgi:5-methylcytosine-specific restriction endonuclease McrA
MNRWNIPDWLERAVIERDTHCVYCGVKFSSSNKIQKFKPSWEHIVNDAKIVTLENIARCCRSCNSSKRAKLLADWLDSNYCKKLNITKDSVAKVVNEALNCPPSVGENA